MLLGNKIDAGNNVSRVAKLGNIGKKMRVLRVYLETCFLVLPYLTNKANSNSFEVENAYKAKLWYFGRPVAKGKLSCRKIFRTGNRAGVFIWENFHTGCRDLGCRNRDLAKNFKKGEISVTGLILRAKALHSMQKRVPVSQRIFDLEFHCSKKKIKFCT